MGYRDPFSDIVAEHPPFPTDSEERRQIVALMDILWMDFTDIPGAKDVVERWEVIRKTEFEYKNGERRTFGDIMDEWLFEALGWDPKTSSQSLIFLVEMICWIRGGEYKKFTQLYQVLRRKAGKSTPSPPPKVVLQILCERLGLSYVDDSRQAADKLAELLRLPVDKVEKRLLGRSLAGRRPREGADKRSIYEMVVEAMKKGKKVTYAIRHVAKEQKMSEAAVKEIYYSQRVKTRKKSSENP